jgi:hypothetical protein
MSDRLSETRLLYDRAVILREQRDAWRSIALKLAAHVRKWSTMKNVTECGKLLEVVQKLDPSAYEREVVPEEEKTND